MHPDVCTSRPNRRACTPDCITQPRTSRQLNETGSNLSCRRSATMDAYPFNDERRSCTCLPVPALTIPERIKTAMAHIHGSHAHTR